MNPYKTSKLARVALLALVLIGCGASLSVCAQNTYQVSPGWGSSTNDWADIGSFANTGVSQHIVFTVHGHWCGSIISAQFRYDDIAYTGSSTNWMELAPSNGGKVYNGTQPVAIDIKRANPSSTSDPILARIRNLHGMCGGTSLNISIETNTTFTSSNGTGSSGSVDAGYAASDLGWKFPVTTDAHAASRNGLFILNTGNVGIGTTDPVARLHVKTNTDENLWIRSASGLDMTAAKDDQSNFVKLNINAAPLIINNGSGGVVGIGTATPNSGSKLDVRGGLSVNQTQSTTQRGAGLDVGWTGSGNADVYFGDYTNGWALGENPDASMRIFKTSGATLASTPVTIQAGGNVGINTTSPSATLHLKENGANPVAKIEYSNASTQALQFVNTNAGGRAWSIGDGIGTTPGTFGIYDLTAGALAWAIDSSGVQSVQSIHSLSTSSNYFVGKVGFGTQSPGALVSTGGGIGPANQIGLGMVGTSRNKPGLFLGSNESASPFSSTAYFGLQGAPTGYANDFAIVGSADPGTHRYLHIGYNTNDDPTSAFNPKVSIDTFGGNVGIGTTAPGEKLEVSGNLKVSASGSLPGNITAAGTIDAGSIKARYQDVAEWVPSSEQLFAGTVVVLDSTKSNQVTSSSVSYDTRVAGVISEQPGIALGEKSEGKVLVATTGRVRVKVDATKGPIHIGDLLVTSDVPGVAMKSEPIEMAGRKMHMPGTLIGKALEPLEKGSGQILVLLSLQ